VWPASTNFTVLAMSKSQRNPTQYISDSEAVDLILHHDARLMLQHTAIGKEYFILPGGARVKPDDVRKIVYRNDIVGAPDSLIPGELPQTWGRAR
jgi:hypothetical protein